MLKRDRDMSKTNALLQQQVALYEEGNLALQAENDTLHEQVRELRMQMEMLQKQRTARQNPFGVTILQKELDAVKERLENVQKENHFLRSIIIEYYAQNPSVPRKI